MDEPFFALSSYHALLAGCGLAIIAAFWLPRWFSACSSAASALLIASGLMAFGLFPGIPEIFSPVNRPGPWELASEFAVIIALFGTAIRLDRISGLKLWGPTIRLLLIAMPLCILAIAMAGWAMGMAFGSAILLGAVLAPTDPVLAGDVQVNAPHKGGEHPVRFALTAEAGLNDGLAFPFVYLALFVITLGSDVAGWGLEWFGLYVVYKIAVGILGGAAAGWLLGRMLFKFPKGNALAETGAGVIALAGVIFTYGLTELVEGYGFIAAFVMGLVLRRQEEDHEYHARLHTFSEALEHAVTAILLVMLGGALPDLWPHFGWAELGIGLLLIFAIRPLIGLASLWGTQLAWKERGVVAFYGVRGIGSIYYLAYACGLVAVDDDARLWAIVAFTILLSSVVHGLSAGFFIKKATAG